MPFTIKLERADGTPAEPPSIRTAVINWRPGDTIPFGRGRMLRVVRLRDDDADQPPVVVVEDVTEKSVSGGSGER